MSVVISNEKRVRIAVEEDEYEVGLECKLLVKNNKQRESMII